MSARIELDVIQNANCEKNCSKQERKNKTLDELCTITLSEVDGGPIRCVGDWAEQKIYHLVQYFGIFSPGMKNLWAGRNYIEICCGPGRCVNRETGQEFNGTALAIAKHKAMINMNNALFFDLNNEVVVNLNKRFKAIGECKAKAFKGDYNDSSSICTILKQYIPDNHLNLVFIDPTDCGFPFQLVRDIKNVLNNVDFIINVASGTDFNRNVMGVLKNPESFKKSYDKYSNFLGSTDFFSDPKVMQLAYRNDYQQLRIEFRKYYEESLKTLGYAYFDYKPIKHYYDLIFASAHSRGKDFWDKANKIKFDGQREFF